MNENPYVASNTTPAVPGTRATRWMIVVGAFSMFLAALCLIATILLMKVSFDTSENLSNTNDPSELASDISFAVLPSFAIIPLGIVGVVFLILGFVRRQPVNVA